MSSRSRSPIHAFSRRSRMRLSTRRSHEAAIADGPIVTAANPPPNDAAQHVAALEAQGPAAVAPRKVAPISIFVSRKSSRLYVRQGFTPLFDIPVTIRDPEQPLGTHVFTAIGLRTDPALRWTVTSMPEKSPHAPEAVQTAHAWPANRAGHGAVARQSQCGSRSHRNTAACRRAHQSATDAGLFAHRIRLRHQPGNWNRHGFHRGHPVIHRVSSGRLPEMRQFAANCCSGRSVACLVKPRMSIRRRSQLHSRWWPPWVRRQSWQRARARPRRAGRRVCCAFEIPRLSERPACVVPKLTETGIVRMSMRRPLVSSVSVRWDRMWRCHIIGQSHAGPRTALRCRALRWRCRSGRRHSARPVLGSGNDG